jgi:uncharacterized protein YdhG (YjbR/CyaY superfamily)
MIEIENYINSFEDRQVQFKLKELYQLLEGLLPTEINQTISYGVPTFKLKGKNLIHFGGAKSHVAIYPGAAAVAKFQPKLEQMQIKSSKGTIKFNLDKSLPVDLIKSVVEFLLQS